jgi:hypothetical protein
MTDMVKKSIVPAIISYQGERASVAASQKAIGDFSPVDLEVKTLEGVSKLGASLYKKLEALDAAVIGANEHGEAHAKAKFIRDNVITAMCELREVVDDLESACRCVFGLSPTYGEMLFTSTKLFFYLTIGSPCSCLRRGFGFSRKAVPILGKRQSGRGACAVNRGTSAGHFMQSFALDSPRKNAEGKAFGVLS